MFVKIQKWSTFQKAIVLVSIIVVVVGLAAGLLLYPKYLQRANEQAFLQLEQEVETSKILERVEIEQEGAPVQEPEVIEPVVRKISLSATSIELDLKIKIADEDNALVKGVPFVVTIQKDGQKSGKEYTDKDMDGVLHLKELAAGKYVVTLQEVDGFTIAENPITATVKKKIVYVKVDVENEIKKEEEIDVKKEETVTNDVPVEKPVINTLPLLKSTVVGELIHKADIDTADFKKAKVSETQQEIEVRGGIKATLPETALLYVQEEADVNTCSIELQITGDEANIIRGVVWEIEDEEVAVVVHNRKEGEAFPTTVTVVAVKKGTTSLKAVIQYEDEEQEESQRGEKTIQVAITVADYADNKTPLKTKEGTKLYLDEAVTQPALLKDYYLAEKFYIPKYTGWQTIDEKVYYFNENHEKVTGEQTIGYVKYHFQADGALIQKAEEIGIDVSKWQAKIDWKAVAAAGIDFAIIRVGYRGYSTGVLVEDPYFKENIEGATKAGMKVGVYFFTQAITEAEAVEEASMAIALVKGYHLDYPIYIDTELSGSSGNKGRADKLKQAKRTAIVTAFCETVKNAGYKPGVYASTNWYEEQLDDLQLSSYNIWVAQYAETCKYTGKYDVWQYTPKGRVEGIQGNVDMNISYLHPKNSAKEGGSEKA